MTEIEKLQSVPTSNNIAADVKVILAEARRSTARAINTAMVAAYWLIGKRIVVEEQRGAERAGYGENILKNLSKELMAEFGNGFSYSNLRNMRQFYLTYSDSEICQTLSSKLSWSHNRLIMRVQNSDAREWNDSQQLFASKYLPYLPTEEELKRELENTGRYLDNKQNL